jgi:hypothetical protein
MKYIRILSPKRMVSDLRQERVGTYEFYIYAALFVIGSLFSLLVAFGIWDGAVLYRSPLLEFADRILGVVVSFGTIPLAYYINKKGDHKRFWYRYVSLMVPIGIVLSAAGFVFFAFAALIGIINIEYYGYSDLVLFLVFYALAVLLLWESMKRVSTKSDIERRNFLQKLLF